jgi:hypothetical protein
MVRVGFTGTQGGMTLYQRSAFATLIRELAPDEFHHGVCVGADEQAHEIVRREFGETCLLVGHPGVRNGQPYKRSWKAQATLDLVLPEKEMLKRNDDLVVFDHLVAAPAETTPQLRSGTWATIRRAERRGIQIIYLWPTGKEER